MEKLQIEYIPVEDLKPYDRNTRKHQDFDVDQIATSIELFGFDDPIGIWSDKNIIVEGHGRLMAAKKLNMKEVPCIRLDHLTDEQRRAYAIAHNKTAELSEWDFEFLPLEVEELDLSAFDFDFDFETEAEEPEVEAAAGPSVVEDEAPEVDDDNIVTRPGDIWVLGNHRLMCGDSTKETDVAALMDGSVADLVFTDPPYGMKKESSGVANDNLNFDDLLEFNKKWIPLSFQFLKDMGGWYCWGIDEPLMDIYSEILKPMKKRNEIVIRNFLTWAKHSAIGLNSHLQLSYPRETEKCWFVVKGKDWNNTNAEFFNYKYQPVVDYLTAEAAKVELTPKKLRELTGVQMWSHWFTHSQFTVIPEWHYKKLQAEYNPAGAFLLPYEQVRELVGAVDNKKEHLKPYFNLCWFEDGDMPLSDVWRVTTTYGAEKESTGGHATPKPIALCTRGIATSTREGERVLDLFGGSGSTLITCEQLNRICCAMELEPCWCDVIIKRWEALTGARAVLVRNEDHIIEWIMLFLFYKDEENK